MDNLAHILYAVKSVVNKNVNIWPRNPILTARNMMKLIAEQLLLFRLML